LNHLLCLESLLFIRGEKGVSIHDISKLIKIKDYEYSLFLISQLEAKLENSVLCLKYNTKNKRFYLMLKPEFIDYLQNLEIVRPKLSKAATATLAVIILYYYRNQKIDIDLLKSLRGQNVKQHLKELQAANYIVYDDKNETFQITQKLINEVNLKRVADELEKLYE